MENYKLLAKESIPHDCTMVINYHEILKLVIANSTVKIHHNLELGNPCYAIVSMEDLEVWIESFETYEEALEFCAFTGLEIVEFERDSRLIETQNGNFIIKGEFDSD